MKNKVFETKIDSLIPDDLNANKGTEFGEHLMEKSFRELGAGRSILIDKNNRIIAGNKSTEQCAKIGLEDVIVVETDGTKLVAVKRVDIDLDSEKGRTIAISDNATSKANLAWDENAIAQITEAWEIAPEDWGIESEKTTQNNENDDLSEKIKISYKIEIECVNEKEQEILYNEFIGRDIKCRLLTL